METPAAAKPSLPGTSSSPGGGTHNAADGGPQEADPLSAILEPLRQRLGQWELMPREVEVDMSFSIGAGSTSVVYMGRLRGETLVAVKHCVLNKPDIAQDLIQLFLREVEAWSRVNHPHVLKFFGLCRTTSALQLCSEFCRGGTLFDLLHNAWHIPLAWWQRRTILVDISSAVECLHTLQTPIMHRDLKSLNVLLLHRVEDERTKPVVKLADFGFARVRGSQRRDEWSDLTRGAGTPHWMAPEVAAGTCYHEKVDVFSFSIIMYEVVCRHMAFEDLEPEMVRTAILDGVRPVLDDSVLPEDVPAELVQLMKQCWAQDPADRPDMGTVHDTLARIPWPLYSP